MKVNLQCFSQDKCNRWLISCICVCVCACLHDENCLFLSWSSSRLQCWIVLVILKHQTPVCYHGKIEHSCSGTGFALKMSLSDKQKLVLLHHFVIVLRCLLSSSRLTAKLDSLQRHHFPLTLESCKHSLFPLVEPCILHVLFFSAIRILFMRFDQLPADSRCLTFLLEYLGRYGALSLSLN